MPMARWARDARRDPALHRVHGRRALQRLAARRGRPGAGADRRGHRGLAGRAGRRRLSRRGRRSLAVPRRRRRVRGHLVGDDAVLPRLHARPAVGRRQALHVPVRRATATTSARCCATGPRTTGLAARSSPTRGAAATTATPSCGRCRRARAGPTCPRSRCSRWAADADSSTGLSTAVHKLVDSADRRRREVRG